MDYYIVNLSHGKPTDKYVTFWRPECKGYAWPLSWAGQYTEEEVKAHLDYYNSGDNIAVPCNLVDSMSEAPEPDTIDGNAGPVVRNTAENWKTLLSAVIELPKYKLKPPCRRKIRKAA